MAFMELYLKGELVILRLMIGMWRVAVYSSAGSTLRSVVKDLE